jgi:hypothetical protein
MRGKDEESAAGCQEDGNMTSRKENGITWQQDYNLENRLSSISNGTESWTFVYDGSGREAPPKRSGVGYDPQTAHFTQADTVVPNAGDAASYDRYTYVRNNPVSLTDPNGHMFVSEMDYQENHTQAIHSYQSLITMNYSNVRFGGNDWQADELGKVSNALYYMSKTHGGRAEFAKDVGKLNFVNDTRMDKVIAKHANGMAPPKTNLVLLSNNLLSAPDAITETIHEVGHQFDSKNPIYKSQSFINTFSRGSACSPGYLGCNAEADDNPLYQAVIDSYNFINKATGGEGYYNPVGVTSKYGMISSIDDFADSYAYVVLTTNGLDTGGLKVGQERVDIVNMYIRTGYTGAVTYLSMDLK